MKNTEVEITFPLLNPAPVRLWLDAHAQLHHQGQLQKDTYYIPAHQNFLQQQPISNWLRVRETTEGASLNFKHWHSQGNAQAVSCDEFETAVEHAAAAHEILKHIGCSPVVVVEKNRRTYMYYEVEVALDEVAGLGTYIELEAKGNFSAPAVAERHLVNVLQELGAKLGKQDYRGYPYLLLEKAGYTLP